MAKGTTSSAQLRRWLTILAILPLGGGCYRGTEAGLDAGDDAGEGAAADASGSADGDSGEPGGDDGDDGGPVDEADVGADAGIHRLTVDEYVRSVVALLDLDEPFTLDDVQPTMGPHGFRISPPVASVDARALERSAEVAARSYVDRETPCASDPTAACLNDFALALAERAFRRPLTADETSGFAEHVDQRLSESLPTNEIAFELTSRILQGPQMQYLELHGLELDDEPDGPVRRVLSSYELASRLSFALWGAPPDEELLEHAAADELRDAESLRASATRMLATPDAERALGTFVEEWLLLYLVEASYPSVDRYPSFDASLPARMLEESRLFAAESVFRGDGDFKELLAGDFSVVDESLAAVYGLEAPTGDWQRMPLPPERAGLLTQPAFLAANASAEWGDPIHRGVVINERVLCNEIPAPDGIDTEIDLPEVFDDPRDAYPQHEMAACAGCHKMINLAGFGFDRFDAVGAYHLTREEFEGEIDASGSLLVDGEVIEFDGAADAARLIAQSDSASRCMSRYLFRYLVRRVEFPADELAAKQDVFIAEGGKIQDFVLDLVTSQSFTTRVVKGGGE